MRVAGACRARTPARPRRSPAAAASLNRGVVFVFDPRAPAAGRAAEASAGGAGRARRRRRRREREPREAGRSHGTGPGALAPPPPALRLQPPSCATARREGAVRRASRRGPVACHQPDGHHGSTAGAGQVRRGGRAVSQVADLPDRFRGDQAARRARPLRRLGAAPPGGGSPCAPSPPGGMLGGRGRSDSPGLPSARAGPGRGWGRPGPPTFATPLGWPGTLLSLSQEVLSDRPPRGRAGPLRRSLPPFAEPPRRV